MTLPACMSAVTAPELWRTLIIDLIAVDLCISGFINLQLPKNFPNFCQNFYAN